MIETSRRNFIVGATALVAAPAIVRFESIMPVTTRIYRGNALLTIDQITRQAVRLFNNRNKFLENIDYNSAFAYACNEGFRIGDTLCIRLPNDYMIKTDYIIPVIDEKIAMALAAPVVVEKVLEAPVTRRFWDLKK